MYDIPTTMPEYAEHKLNMLTKEFCLKLSKSEKEHMQTLDTMLQVDKYARRLIMEKLQGKELTV